MKGQGIYIRSTGLIFLLFWTLATGPWTPSSHAGIVSSKELIENAKTLDGKAVTYKGEAVTAILNRGDYSWVNLNDGDNAIGVWCATSLLGEVKSLGDYKNKGDTIEVEGVFNRACPLHGGELDIHGRDIKIVKAGYAVNERVSHESARLSAALFALTILAVIIFRKRM